MACNRARSQRKPRPIELSSKRRKPRPISIGCRNTRNKMLSLMIGILLLLNKWSSILRLLWQGLSRELLMVGESGSGDHRSRLRWQYSSGNYSRMKLRRGRNDWHRRQHRRRNNLTLILDIGILWNSSGVSGRRSLWLNNHRRRCLW